MKTIWAPPCSAPRTAAYAPLPPLTPASPPPSSSSESESESEPEMEETSSPPRAIMASNSSSVSGARPCLRRLALYLPRSDLRASRCSRAEAKPWSRQASMRPTRGPRAAPATSSNGDSSPARDEGLAPSGPVASSSSSSSSPGRRSATGAPRRLSTRVGAGAAHIVLIAAEGGGRDSPRGSRAAR